MKKQTFFLIAHLICIVTILYPQQPINTFNAKQKHIYDRGKNYYKYFQNPSLGKYELYQKYLQQFSMSNLKTQSPKIAGPVTKEGLITIKPSDNYLQKDSLHFDNSSIETITNHDLIKHYKNAVILDIPPRRMWGWGGDSRGYCGETSFQMCGLFWGNWISSELIRYAANNEELLIGDSTDPDEDNDIKAANILKFSYERFSSHKPHDFIKWAKNHIDNGNPVILGWYQHHKPKEDADDDYDHIMPIIGYSTDQSEQVNGLYFYDLYLKNYSLIQGSTYQDFIQKFVKSRKETKRLTSYKVPNHIGLQSNIDLPGFENGKNSFEMHAFTYAIPKNKIYALAITGIKNDSKTKLFRTKLSINRWHEPDWGFENKKNERPISVKLIATIYGLTPGEAYSIFRFEPKINKTKKTINTKAIPTLNYIDSSYTEKIDFIAEKSVEKIDLGYVKSDGAYFYRTIKNPPN